MAYANTLKALAGKVGKAIDTTRKISPLPDFGISEKLESYGASRYTPAQQVTQVQNDPRFRLGGAGTPYPSAYQVPNQPSYNPGYSTSKPYVEVPGTNYRTHGSVQGASTENINVNTGGQAPGGGSGSAGGGGGNPGSGVDLLGLGITDAAYRRSAGDINAQGALLDQEYGVGKGDVENAIAEAEAAAKAQEAQTAQDYGTLLGNQLRTYQDTNRQRQGIFSSLGTLDSSAFQEQQFRGDQAYGQERAGTEGEQQKAIGQIRSTKDSYVNRAKSELSRLAIEYQRGKNAVASALANNDIEGAGAISDYLREISATAQGLKGSLTDTLAGIRGVGAPAYAPNQQQVAMSAMYTQPQQQGQSQGQGYISPSGRRYGSILEYLMNPA